MTGVRRRVRAWSWCACALVLCCSSIAATSARRMDRFPADVRMPHVSTRTARHGAPAPRGTRELADSLDSVDLNALIEDIGYIDCSEGVHGTIKTIFSANAVLVDACTTDSGFKLFPYDGRLPDQDQTAKVCASPSCMDLLSGVVLAKLPECEADQYSPRSMAESFIRVRVDLANNRPAPKASEFGELYTLNRVVNYLVENATIQAAVTTTFKATETAALMNAVEINPDVVLSEDMVVYIQPKSATSTSGSTSSGSSQSASGGSGTSAKNNDAKATSGSSGSASTSSSSSDTDASSTGNGSGADLEIASNLEMAYLYVALFWFGVNALYLWAMARKGFEDD